MHLINGVETERLVLTKAQLDALSGTVQDFTDFRQVIEGASILNPIVQSRRRDLIYNVGHTERALRFIVEELVQRRTVRLYMDPDFEDNPHIRMPENVIRGFGKVAFHAFLDSVYPRLGNRKKDDLIKKILGERADLLLLPRGKIITLPLKSV